MDSCYPNRSNVFGYSIHNSHHSLIDDWLIFRTVERESKNDDTFELTLDISG